MAEITRETLELAALAAGGALALGTERVRTGETWDEWEWRGPLSIVINGRCLRPHLDDGDAARLADKLLMYVESRGTAVQARVVGAEWHRVARDGNTSAWREAVVLCAADAGKRMKGGA